MLPLGLYISVPMGTWGLLVALHGHGIAGSWGSPPQALTSELLIRQTLLVGEQEGQETLQAIWGPPGDNVKEDGSVENLEDRWWAGSRPLGASHRLPATEQHSCTLGSIP